jgi:hypothetical protein
MQALAAVPLAGAGLVGAVAAGQVLLVVLAFHARSLPLLKILHNVKIIYASSLIVKCPCFSATRVSDVTTEEVGR